MRDDGRSSSKGTDETVAAPAPSASQQKLAQGTTPGLEPTIDARVVPAGTVTRASSPTLSRIAKDHSDLPVVDPANYQIVKELARGGMGRILEARDLRLGRPIAIKEVLHNDDTARARFDREVRITARLQHPAIVHVTEAGQWPTGQPFFAMKLIRGKPLDHRIIAAKDLGERLSLLSAVTAVVDALAYAHSQSVIHRDLKPANVLVGDFGETVVIDWGIAKDLEDSEEIVSIAPRDTFGGETIEGSVIGTPSYMPPEQATGARVDERADVYALGALLYQLLAGVPPYVGRTTAEVLTKVIDEPPQPLATVVPDAPADLIAIVEKAMAREPDQRFPTANEMAVELKRFQQGQLVKSHDYTTRELIVRYIRRNRAAVAVGAIAIVTLGVLAVFGIAQILDERRRADAERLQARAQADSGTIADAKLAIETDPTDALAILKRLYPDTGETRRARIIAADAAALGIAHVMQGGGAIESLAISTDGRSLVSYEVPGGTVRLWDLATWTGRPIGGAPEVLDVAATPDGVLAIDMDGRIWRWRTNAVMPAPPVLVRTITGRFDRARFSPDAKRILVEGTAVNADGPPEIAVRLVDLQREDRALGMFQDAEWAPDSASFVAYARWKRLLYRVDVASGDSTKLLEGAYSPAFTTDGKRVWVASDGASAKSQNVLRELTGNAYVPLDMQLVLMAPLPDGRVVGTTSRRSHRIMTESLRGQIKGTNIPFVRDMMSTGEHSLIISDGWPGSIARLKGHATPIESLVTRGDLIASGDSNGSIRVWRVPPIARDHGDGHTTATFATIADRHLVVTHRGPRLDLHDLLSGDKKRIEITETPQGMVRDMTRVVERNTFIGSRFIRETIQGPDDEVIELARASGGRHLATVDSGGHAVAWDLVAGRGKLLADGVVHVAISSDGSRVATSRKVGDEVMRDVEIWEVATGQPTKLGEMVPLAMVFGPGERLAIATNQPSIYVFDRGVGRKLETNPHHNYRSLTFSADGRHLYAGTDNWVIEEFDLVENTNRMLRGHMGTVVGLLLDRDGKRLFSASADNTVRVWNLEDASSTALRGHSGLVTSMELGENDTLLTASEDRTARIWDLQKRENRVLSGHEDRAVFAAHVANGQRIVVVDRFRQIAEYADNLPHDEHLLRAWLDAATNLEK